MKPSIPPALIGAAAVLVVSAGFLLAGPLTPPGPPAPTTPTLGELKEAVDETRALSQETSNNVSQLGNAVGALAASVAGLAPAGSILPVGLDAVTTITGGEQGDISAGASSVTSLGPLAPDPPLPRDGIATVNLSFGFKTDGLGGSGGGGGVRPKSFSNATLVKYTDRSSPLLLNAWATEELLTVSIYRYRSDSSGAREEYYREDLSNAIITDIEQVGPNLERLTIEFRELTVTHLPADTTATVRAPGLP